MLALFVFGAFNGVLDVSMNAHGVLVEGRLARPVMSSFHGMWSLGGLAGAGFAAALLPLMPALAQAFLALAICTVIAVAALFFLLPSAADGRAGGPAFALPTRLTLALGILCFLCMMAEGAITDWAALHLKGAFALGAGPAATGFAAFSAAMAASRFGGDWLRGHIGAVVLVRGSALLAAAGLSVALLSPAPMIAIAGYAIVGLGLGNLVPIFFGAAGRIPGERPGTGIAAVATVGYTGFLVGPPVIGFIADATGLATALGILLVGCLASALAAGAVAPAERHGLAAAR
jgi:hypothetical protein